MKEHSKDKVYVALVACIFIAVFYTLAIIAYISGGFSVFSVTQKTEVQQVTLPTQVQQQVVTLQQPVIYNYTIVQKERIIEPKVVTDWQTDCVQIKNNNTKGFTMYCDDIAKNPQ